MNKVQLETLLKENPAAMAAVQKMTAIKLQGRGKRKVQATTALKDKEHPSHTKAVGIFQKLKDMLSKEKKNEPEFKDYTPTQSDTDFYRKQYAGRTGKELGEDRMQEMTSKTKRDMENSFETSEDLDDFITKHQSEIPKNQWRKIDNYLDDIRDEEQGMKSSGWADPAKKGLKKILTRYIKESKELNEYHSGKLSKLKVPSDVSYYNRDWKPVFKEWGDIDYGPRESDMYDWNDRRLYDKVVKEFNAEMGHVAAQLNKNTKNLENAWKSWNRILDKWRDKDRS